MLVFEEGNVIENPDYPFIRTESAQLVVDCALQGYFYCKECEAYTYHFDDETLENTCECCSYR